MFSIEQPRAASAVCSAFGPVDKEIQLHSCTDAWYTKALKHFSLSQGH